MSCIENKEYFVNVTSHFHDEKDILLSEPEVDECSVPSSDNSKRNTRKRRPKNIIESVPQILWQTIENVEKMPEIAKTTMVRIDQITDSVMHSLEKLELLMDAARNSNEDAFEFIELSNILAKNVRQVTDCFTDLIKTIEKVILNSGRAMNAAEKVLKLIANVDSIAGSCGKSNGHIVDGTNSDIDDDHAIENDYDEIEMSEEMYLNFALDNMDWTWENSILCITGELGKTLKNFSTFLREQSNVPEEKL